ncbi:MAG: cyclic nucleotide-binding domain-containing protein [Deltaproteobacteria bacterium]|nr:cyclic nucleotide-binding domain-containing protein [Deltaproteobacteria bacterium]
MPLPRIIAASLLEEGESFSTAHRLTKLALVAFILISITAIVCETTVSGRTHGTQLQAVEYLAGVLFVLELLLRLWVAPELMPDGLLQPSKARWAYLCSVYGVIDLVAIVPFLLGLVLPMDADWLRVLRLLRVLKLARYVPAIGLFAAVLRAERRPLLAALMVMLVLLLINSAAMYALEHDAQPTSFSSIPHAMWWCMVTMATVGYGDIIPVTAAGRVFGGFVMLFGIAMFAVPAGILATGFAAEIRKRDFVVTWQMVAKLPLFAHLDAGRIAEIAGLLKRQVVPAQYVVVRRGETADSMYFILEGEVEVDIQPVPLRLRRGQYFGELALLNDTVRNATVTAVSDCLLLTLDAADFRRMLNAHPDLKQEMTELAQRRLNPTQGSGASE